MNNNYLIPANSKKSQLILGFFTPLDLILFGSGCGLTVLLLIVLGIECVYFKSWEMIK